MGIAAKLTEKAPQSAQTQEHDSNAIAQSKTAISQSKTDKTLTTIDIIDDETLFETADVWFGISLIVVSGIGLLVGHFVWGVAAGLCISLLIRVVRLEYLKTTLKSQHFEP